MRSVLSSLRSLVMVALLACGDRTAPPVQATEGTVLTLVLFSGREQPPPEERKVPRNTLVTIRVQGLGPARIVVVGPDGALVATSDSPLYLDGGASSVIGTEQRFTPTAPGLYRIEAAEARDLVLANLIAL